MSTVCVRMSAFVVLVLTLLLAWAEAAYDPSMELETKTGQRVPTPVSVVKGSRNAIFLLDSENVRHLFPDFFTFTKLGFTVDDVKKISDEKLNNIALGDTIKAIPAPPPFRPDDFHYHELCEDPRRMVDDLGVVANTGDFHKIHHTIQRAQKTKKLEVVLLGGSITAGGYFMEFFGFLRDKDGINVTFYNHGHGATDTVYTIYCVDIERHQPDLVMIDFAVNDNGHPKLMDALIRKVLQLPSSPLVLLVNLWVHQYCPTARYLFHSQYYNLPLLNICPAANLCFGKRLPKYISDQYSKTDGVHPWGEKGVLFIGQIIYAWWKRYEDIVHSDASEVALESGKSVLGSVGSSVIPKLPPALFKSNPIGDCTRCDALVDDADNVLAPVSAPKGFRIVKRVKIGFGGFNPENRNSSTKSFKKSWQSETPGSTISFKFYGTTVLIAMWQRRDGMGVLHATVDGNTNHVAKASGFFKGYSWAMERNNTGRSEIVTLFEGLEDKEHILTLTVSDEPANVWVKGHTCQVFALLSASNNPQCKSKVLKL